MKREKEKKKKKGKYTITIHAVAVVVVFFCMLVETRASQKEREREKEALSCAPSGNLAFFSDSFSIRTNVFASVAGEVFTDVRCPLCNYLVWVHIDIYGHVSRSFTSRLSLALN